MVRRRPLLLLLFCLLGVVPHLAAQEKGDQVLVVASQAPLQVETRQVGAVPRGQALTVERQQDQWLWVSYQEVSGWTKRSNVAPLSDALARLRQGRPESAASLLAEGSAFLQQGAPVAARLHLDRALELDDQLAPAYVLRGLVSVEEEQYLPAKEDLDQAIELDGGDAMALLVRGKLLRKAGQYEQARADIEQALNLDARQPNAHIQHALLLAASEDGEVRDGKQAVQSAQTACQLTRWGNARALLALSIALAETGEFQTAAERARAARSLGDSEVRQLSDELLALYAEEKPYRETVDEQAREALQP